jgi:hypothetical protein
MDEKIRAALDRVLSYVFKLKLCDGRHGESYSENGNLEDDWYLLDEWLDNEDGKKRDAMILRVLPKLHKVK